MFYKGGRAHIVSVYIAGRHDDSAARVYQEVREGHESRSPTRQTTQGEAGELI